MQAIKDLIGLAKEMWVLIVMAILAIVLGALMTRWECLAKTSEMGFQSRWGVVMGCQIEVEPGQWIPLESYYFKQE